MTFVISHTGFSGFIYHDPLRHRHKAHARVPRAPTAHAAIASAAAPSPKKLTARRPRTSRRHLAGHTMRPLGTRPLTSCRSGFTFFAGDSLMLRADFDDIARYAA